MPRVCGVGLFGIFTTFDDATFKNLKDRKLQ